MTTTNYHIGFVKGQTGKVLVKQDGYEDKEYDLEFLQLILRSKKLKSFDADRLEVLTAARDTLLQWGQQ